jgi:hypothetical protein
MPSAITPIASITTTTAVNSIVFSSINQTYRDLLVVVRGNMTSGGWNMGISLPSGLWHRTYLQTFGGGSTPTGSGTNTSLLHSQFSSGNLSYEVIIYDYAQTDKFKSFTMMDGSNNGGAAGMTLHVGSHNVTSALTQLTVSAPGTTLVAGFSVSIYGVSL